MSLEFVAKAWVLNAAGQEHCVRGGAPVSIAVELLEADLRVSIVVGSAAQPREQVVCKDGAAQLIELVGVFAVTAGSDDSHPASGGVSNPRGEGHGALDSTCSFCSQKLTTAAGIEQSQSDCGRRGLEPPSERFKRKSCVAQMESAAISMPRVIKQQGDLCFWIAALYVLNTLLHSHPDTLEV